MKVYLSDGRRHRAWSTMQCDWGYGKTPHDHEAHAWSGQHTIYGPYFCPGRFEGQVRTDWSTED